MFSKVNPADPKSNRGLEKHFDRGIRLSIKNRWNQAKIKTKDTVKDIMKEVNKGKDSKYKKMAKNAYKKVMKEVGFH